MIRNKEREKGSKMTPKHVLLSSAALAACAWFGSGMTASAGEFYQQCPGPVNADGEVLDGVGGQVIRMDGTTTSTDLPAASVCYHIVGSDGFIRMADGAPLYSFGFSPLANGLNPGTRALKSNLPAPLIRAVEGQKVYLTMSNVPFIIRPDLFDPHSVHWHGFPNASAVFDGVPDNSISPNPQSSMTYFYNVARPGTFMYHCHVEAAEHMQMGMVGNLYVEAAQDYLPDGTDLNGFTHRTGDRYAYNDGDGSTYFDVEIPIQINSYDGAFHTAHYNVQPLPFAEMEDTYPMLNGRGYPDTIRTDLFLNANPDFPGTTGGGLETAAQPLSALISAAPNDKVLLRVSSLSTVDYYTLVSPDLTMQVVGQGSEQRVGPDLGTGAPTNAYYNTHQLTLGGGQSYDVILDIPADASGSTYFLYTSNLNQLANDQQDYGGMMTEIQVQ